MVELRDYQQHLLAQVQDFLAEPSARVMLQLPTGGGKTRIAGELLRWWLTNGSKAVWLTHRKELSDQTCQVLNNSGVRAVNSLPWVINRPAPFWEGGVVVLMAQTVSHRNRWEGVWDNYRDRDLLIIDEAHHARAVGWERAINQWPGPVVGLTATPWRNSKIEGFKHLFDTLVLGPQIHELQSQGYLASANVKMPERDNLILPGEIIFAGDYSEPGIVQANQGKDVWTAGAFRFWKQHARHRQTIVYAVSVDHAKNLAEVFRDGGEPAEVLLGDTPTDERRKSIRQFSNGDLRVLINVVVATEGFDLPDASCVVLARPTLSLALYLQMVGRGLRPKSDGSDCLILDLAGNVERHGFPEDVRDWSLEPRGSDEGNGLAPTVRCSECSGVSPAASHYCRHCNAPLGKDCERCGKWRAWKVWSAETYCGDEHDLVCNRCHVDAHDLATLPEGLMENIRKELNEEPLRVNPSSLQTFDEFRSVLSEAAEALTCAYKVDDFAGFNRRTKEIRQILRQEPRLRRVAEAKADEVLEEIFAPIFMDITQQMQGWGYQFERIEFEVDFLPVESPRVLMRAFREGEDVGEDLVNVLTLDQMESIANIFANRNDGVPLED